MNSEKLLIARARRRAKCARRRAWQHRRTVAWVDHNLMRAMHKLTGMLGWEIDHLVPLGTAKAPALTAEGHPVSGLHCELNLQPMPRSANRKKRSRMLPEEQRYVEGWRPGGSPFSSLVTAALIIAFELKRKTP